MSRRIVSGCPADIRSRLDALFEPAMAFAPTSTTDCGRSNESSLSGSSEIDNRYFADLPWTRNPIQNSGYLSSFSFHDSYSDRPYLDFETPALQLIPDYAFPPKCRRPPTSCTCPRIRTGSFRIIQSTQTAARQCRPCPCKCNRCRINRGLSRCTGVVLRCGSDPSDFNDDCDVITVLSKNSGVSELEIQSITYALNYQYPVPSNLSDSDLIRINQQQLNICKRLRLQFRTVNKNQAAIYCKVCMRLLNDCNCKIVYFCEPYYPNETGRWPKIPCTCGASSNCCECYPCTDLKYMWFELFPPAPIQQARPWLVTLVETIYFKFVAISVLDVPSDYSLTNESTPSTYCWIWWHNTRPPDSGICFHCKSWGDLWEDLIH